ncbi:MAG: acyltransferase family protein [Actinomycetes bacterium]
MSTPSAAASRARSGFRPEIHGLRGLAILLVVAYHLWTSGRVSGGVDVFLFISAFLMTASFARRGTAFRLADFIVQRFRHLVPLAAIVIAATLAVGWLVLPPTRYASLLEHGRDSLIYRENWRLIADAVSYTAADPQNLNPLQHFWSLSVQGQVFLLVPLIFVISAFGNSRFDLPLVSTLAVLLSVTTVASFAYAQHVVATAPVSAYFDTWARVWEFTLAGLVALIPSWTPPVWLGRLMSWSGVGLLLATGVLWGRGDFPGTVALAPLGAAALVILAGARSADPWHAAWWLARRPVTFIANRAYSLYLWHWPVYVFFLVISSTTNPRTGPVGSAVVLTVSLVLADASTRLVERRFHRIEALRSKRFAVSAILAFSLIAVSVMGGVQALIERESRIVAGLAPEQRPGARVLVPDASPPASPGPPTAGPGRGIAPGDTAISDNWPVPFPACDPEEPGHPPRPELGWCHVFERGVVPSTKTIAVVGDSHAYQWMTALIPLANQENWRVIAYVRPACRVGSPSDVPGCPEYTAEAVAWVLALQPDWVFSTGSSARADGPEHDDWGWASAVVPITEAGIPVVNIRDNPRWLSDMPECVQRYGVDDPRCFARRSEKLAEAWPKGALEGLDGHYFLDLSDWICPPGKVSLCPAVIGNTYVYMDTNHLSRAYVETLIDVFAEAWREEVGT